MRSYSWEGLEKALETEESHCKGPEVWSSLEYSRNRKEVCEAGAHYSDQGYLASDSLFRNRLSAGDSDFSLQLWPHTW